VADSDRAAGGWGGDGVKHARVAADGVEELREQDSRSTQRRVTCRHRSGRSVKQEKLVTLASRAEIGRRSACGDIIPLPSPSSGKVLRLYTRNPAIYSELWRS